MANRQVTATGKNSDGDITKLCGSWGSRTKSEAISDIESGQHAYRSGTRLIEVITDPTVGGGKYLRSRPDGGTGNNLDSLPDC